MTARDAPVVLNRHHFWDQAIPSPWIYIGRGTAFGNPYPTAEHGRAGAYDKYRKYLWQLFRQRDREFLGALAKITAETHLVCSCKPAACHGDVLVKAWCWAKAFASFDELDLDHEPDWVTESLSSLGFAENRSLFDV